METLSFYKLSLYTEDFKLLGFPPCIRDFVFLRDFACTGDFWVFTNFPPYTGTLYFYWFSPALGLYGFMIPPCAEDFAFYDISYLLETLGFYKFSLYWEL